MCIRIGFNVIYDMQLCAVRWWASPLLMDLSPHTRVYVRGGRSVSNRSGFWPVQSGTWLQIPIKRSLDLSWLMCWLSYVGYQYDTVARQPSAWICHLPESLKRFLRSLWGPVCHHLYTSDKPFSELHHLAIFLLSWLMTLAPTNEAIRCDIKREKRPYLSRQKYDRLDGMSHNMCKDRFLSKNVRLLRVGVH